MSTGEQGKPQRGERDQPQREQRDQPPGEGSGHSYWSGYDVLWGLTEPPAPRRGAGLDREAIVRAAVEIADADGIEAVSMRRIAERLGTGPMSLYRHVPDKDALINMMVDAVIGDATLAAPGDMPPGWRDALRLLAEATWRVARAHPWYPEAVLARPPLTPHGVAGLELGLAIFDGHDIDIATKMLFVGAVHFAALSAAMNLAIEERTRARLRMTERELITAGAPFLQRMAESGRYPRVTALFTRFVTGTQADDSDDGGVSQMRGGVELILDGIAVRLAAPGRRRGGREDPRPRSE